MRSACVAHSGSAAADGCVGVLDSVIVVVSLQRSLSVGILVLSVDIHVSAAQALQSLSCFM